jgi:hypothetical protein
MKGPAPFQKAPLEHVAIVVYYLQIVAQLGQLLGSPRRQARLVPGKCQLLQLFTLIHSRGSSFDTGCGH